ncbi:RGS1-HXK1-interacting protein 1-like isoform X1 [Zingiber officinale]|nr:RGS1-HXK1-interacting protein 1-like isoform X1 [Zingiber officinale]
MAAIADSSNGSHDGSAARVENKGADGSSPAAPWIEHALRGAEDLKQAVTAAAETAFQVAGSSADEITKTVTSSAVSAMQSAGSSLSWAFLAYSETLDVAKDKIQVARDHYAATEEMAVAKIKEGIIEAATHPAMSCGIAAGLGLVLLKRPRRYLIRNTRRIFVSEESLLSSAEAKVKELQQSVNMVTNESKKLEDRATRALDEIKRGQRTLMEEGRQIQMQLNATNPVEKELMSLKDSLIELPKADASRYRSEVSAISSQIKQERKSLHGALSRIIDHGIPL